MTTPISFVSKSARFGLPFLFSGQSQKEFYINEAHALTDALLHPVVEGTAGAPPAQSLDGTCWVIGPNPTGAWSGHPNEFACYLGGTWLFAIPTEGMRVMVRSSGADMRFKNGWHDASSVAVPTGGSTVDTEARATITQLIQTLKDYGVTQ